VVEAVRAALSDGVYIVAENFAGEIDRERAVLRHNELRSRVVFLATVGDEVIGWVHLDAPEQDKLDHTAEMTVGVVPDYRGRGVGGRLMDRGVRWAREHGYEKLYNSVPSTNQRAIDWLETRGWEVEAVRENHYRVGGEYVDEVMMARWP
jgi:ribosomal protein S18 acetylase RimI-like enzyme